MAQRLAVIGFIVAAVVAIFAFVQQQQTVEQANTALTAQANAEEQATTAAGQVEVASAAQAQAEDDRAAAESRANAAETAQSQAQATADAAAADSALAATGQALSQATTQAQLTEIAGTATAAANDMRTQQAQSESDLATAGAQLMADATAEALFAQVLGTATAQVDLAQFAAAAAEDDRAAALAQSRAAQTLVAQLQSDLATAQFQLTGLPPAPTSAAPTLPPATTVSAAASPTAAPQSSTADTNLSQQFTSEDGSLQFSYPTGWLAVETGQGPVVIVSSREVGTRTEDLLQAGQVEVTVLILPGSGVTGKTSGTSTVVEVADSLVGTIAGQGSQFTLEAVTEVALDSLTIARSQGSDGSNDVVVLVMDTGNDLFGVLLGRVASGERDQIEPILLAILQSIAVQTAGG